MCTVPFPRVQSRASRVVFSIGSPTIVPSSSWTRACAAARHRVVSFPVSLTSSKRRGSLALNNRSIKRRNREEEANTYSTPATPSTTNDSAVIVPVLSKQQTSTRPAKGIRKGSVQKIAADC